MKIVFFGTSEFAVPALKALHAAGHDTVAVVTTPDKPAGRKRELAAPPVKLAALDLDLLVHQPASLKEFEMPAFDLGVVAAYGKIIPRRILDMPAKGFLNIHPSLLPKYRGPTPIQSAILNGEAETGITIMQVDPEVDHGPIILQQPIAIGPSETYLELHDRLAAEGAQMLVAAIENRDSLESKQQDHDHATFTKMFERAEGRIDWSKPAGQIHDQIRALNPDPGTWTIWQDKILNIKRAVASGDRLEPLAVQLEGGKEMPFADFLRGHPDFNLPDCK